MNGEEIEYKGAEPDLLKLYGIQMQCLHEQLSHILLIRSWAATLAVGLLIALVNFADPIIAVGTGILIVFWVLDKRFGDHFTKYLDREKALRESLANGMSPGRVKDAFAADIPSPGTRHWYYVAMFAIVWIPAVAVSMNWSV